MFAPFKLEIHNFRSYQHAELQFDGSPLILHGENGAGKTNLLEAISMFTPGRGLRRADRAALAHAPRNLGWKLLFSNRELRIENFARFNEPRQILINDKHATQIAMSAKFRQVWMLPSQDRLWQDSASERRRFFDRIVLSFIPEHAEAVLQYEKSMRTRNRLLKDGVLDDNWFKTIEANMAQAAQNIIQNRADALAILNAEIQNAQSEFPQAELALSYQIDPQNADWAQIWADNRTIDRSIGSTRMGAHRVEFAAVFMAKNMEAALCSTGEQKALLISLFLANARALARNQQGLFLLLDEAVAHLDPNRRAALFEELLALDAQVVMTGTEKTLFSSLDRRAEFLEIVEKNGISEIKGAT